MKKITLFICITVLFSCKENQQIKNNLKKRPITKNTTLEFLWETDTLLTTVESVIYDAKSNYIYTTNIDGHFLKKDGKGSVSKVSLKGEIIERNWISGLNAPTGTAIYNGKLYVTDIDRIIEINIKTGKIINTYDIEGAKALNDIEVTNDGTVYTSDTGGNQIFSLKNGEIKIVLDSIDTPNGLLMYNDKLLVTRWMPKTLNTLNIETKELIEIANGLEGPDGIEVIGDKGYLVSGFKGLIHFVANDGTKIKLLDTTAKNILAADIDYIEEKQLLLIPTMQGNKIMAYKLNN